MNNIIIDLDKSGCLLNIFLNSPQKTCCGYSLEAPCQGASNEYHNIWFCGEMRKLFSRTSWINKKNMNTFWLKQASYQELWYINELVRYERQKRPHSFFCFPFFSVSLFFFLNACFLKNACLVCFSRNTSRLQWLSWMFVWLVIRLQVWFLLGRGTFFFEIAYEIFCKVILSLRLIQQGQLSFSAERMCTSTG